jgi:LytR_cpsA_psr family/LytR cell envelope-related transcriptional attenuator
VADLYLPGGDTLPDDETRPTPRAAGSRPWDRAVPATAADRGVFWVPEAGPETGPDAPYPTRMARRRALEAAQTLDAWQPDPVLTPPLLARVGEELLRLFDEPLDARGRVGAHARTSEPPAAPPTHVADDESAPAAPRRRHRPEQLATSSPRRGWRRGRPGQVAAPASGWDEAAIPTPRIVRQDDPVDDAAWFAGLKEMTLAEERGEAEEPPSTQQVASPVRPHADTPQIVPASAPRSVGSARRWVAAAVAAIVVLGAGVAVALNRGGADVEAAAGTSVTPQQAIVVAFSLSEQAAKAARGPAPTAKKKGAKVVPAPAGQAQAGDVTGLSLLAAGGGSAQQVLVPSRLLLDVPGAGRVPMSRALAGSAEAPGQAITDALEVEVDATWTLDSGALAALVDRVGGVVVNVDADITKGTQVGAAVLVGAGSKQKLAGEQAAQFAQFLGADEPEAARLARQEQVLRAVLSALPDDPATIRTVVGDLPGAPDGAALEAVARVVSASRLAAVSNELASTVLPTKEIDAGGSVMAYGLDDKAAAELVDARLSGARLPVASVGHVRVLVQNGVGAPGLGDSARSRLLKAGLRYVSGGNLPGFGQGESVVLLRDASSANRARGTAVARALGLGESSLRVSETAPTVADIVVILGKDYKRS